MHITSPLGTRAGIMAKTWFAANAECKFVAPRRPGIFPEMSPRANECGKHIFFWMKIATGNDVHGPICNKAN